MAGKLLREFGSPEAIFSASLTALEGHRLPAAVAQAIHSRQPMSAAAKELAQVQEKYIFMVDDEAFINGPRMAKLAVVFNFLSSPALAATAYLTWHQAETVLSFARTLSPTIERWDRYLKGDTTIAIRKDPEPA